MEIVTLILGGGILMGLAAILTVFATRKRDRNTDLQERFDATSETAIYMRAEIEKEVERQVAPIREELSKVKAESHEMNDVVRTREVRIWMWDHGGRRGDIPM